MKDILITRKRQKTELKIWLICLGVSFVLNIYAIIAYEGQWTELFTSIGFILTSSVVMYVVILFIRLVYYGMRRILKRTLSANYKNQK